MANKNQYKWYLQKKKILKVVFMDKNWDSNKYMEIKEIFSFQKSSNISYKNQKQILLGNNPAL